MAALTKKVLFLTNIPSPYQIDFFSELHKQPGIDLHVLFAASSEIDRSFTVPKSFSFDASFLRSKTFSCLSCDAHYVKNLSNFLYDFQDCDLAVISGSYLMPVALQLRRWCQRNNIPWIFWGENPWKKHIGKPPIWKRLYLRYFLRTSSGAFGVGNQACTAFKSLLGTEKWVENLPYAPNLSRITHPSTTTLEIAKILRAGWDHANPIVVTFSGTLTYRKAPDMLVTVFALLADSHPRMCMLFVGDGPMRVELESNLKIANLHNRVRFLGFVENEQLYAAYLASNIFVLPTRTHEGWGVVVQEALAAGLPVLVSDRVGSGSDLVNSQTGRIFIAGNQESLAKELDTLLRDLESRYHVSREDRIAAAEKTSCTFAAKRAANALLSNHFLTRLR